MGQLVLTGCWAGPPGEGAIDAWGIGGSDVAVGVLLSVRAESVEESRLGAHSAVGREGAESATESGS